VTSVKSKTKLDIGNGTENDNYLRLLAHEFSCEDLLFVGSSAESASELRSLAERIADYKNEIRELRSRLLTVEAELSALTAEFATKPTGPEAELGELRILADRPDSDPNSQLSAPSIGAKSWKPIEITDETDIEVLKRGDWGVMGCLFVKCRGNAVDKGLVRVTMKSVSFGQIWESARQFFEPTAALFQSQDSPGQWVCFDFQEIRIKLTGYAIVGDVPPLILSWVLEISMDGQNWRDVDRQNLERTTRGVRKYSVAGAPEARFIRLTQTGPNAGGSNVKNLCMLDLFGQVLEYRE
jgi:hypothetical protein